MSTLAIIPARGGSKRITDKNLRPFLGTPLLSWTIRFARSLGKFDTILVSTDSPAIVQLAEAEHVPVPWLRPDELSSDTAGSVDVALHALERERQAGRCYDMVALLQPTSPIRLAQRWDEAFERAAKADFAAAIGVVPASAHPFLAYEADDKGFVRPFIKGRSDLRKLRSQDFPPAYSVAGNLYLVATSILQEAKTFFPEGTAGIICDQPCEAFDIDTIADWVAAEAVARYYEQEPWPRS